VGEEHISGKLLLMEAISVITPICWGNHRPALESLKAPESACLVKSLLWAQQIEKFFGI